MRSAIVLTSFLLAAAGCASSSPRGLLRVDLPGPETGPGSPQEQQLVDSVRAAAGAEGLTCQPGLGPDLLRCSADAVGSGSKGITVGLERSGSGHEIAVRQAIRLPGTRSRVCEVQRRILDRLEGELRAPAARVDGRSDCGR